MKMTSEKFTASSLPTFKDSKSFLELQKDTYNSLPSYNNQTQNPTVNYIEHYRNIYASPENFIKRRVDYGRMKVYDEKYRKELERRNSFIKFPSNLNHLINSLAKSGFYHVGKEGEQPDRVKCIFCQGTLHSWKKTDVPHKEHKKCFPTCPFILNLNVGNEPLKEESQNFLQVDPDLAKCPDDRVIYNVVKSDLTNNFDLPINCYDDCDWRETSFGDKWPQLQHLALYGSYVQERNNCPYIVCYRCHKSTELLPGAEHLNMKVFHKNTCTLISEFSKEDISKTQSVETTKSNQKKSCTVEYSITDEEIEARLDSRFANKITTAVQEKNDIKVLISQKLKRTGKDYDSIVDLFYDLKTYEMKRGESNSCVDEDEDTCEFAMRDLVCVVCLDSPPQVVYLPCGHFKTCRLCSNSLKSCPVCRKLIERRVYGIQFHLTS